MSETVRYIVTVKGYVQGVGYRYFCYKLAKSLGVFGYVRNLFNGDVELDIEGSEGILNDYVKELRIGPQGSVVKSVNIQRIEKQGFYEEFSIK
jgi:acylphosphatase